MQHYLEIPFIKVDSLKEKYKLTPIKGGVVIYTGTMLPKELRIYRCRDFSYTRWMEDERNAVVLPPEKTTPHRPLKKHQQRTVNIINTAYREEKGGFLLSEETGLKTQNTAIAAMKKIARQNNYGETKRGKLLIVTTASETASWRQLLYSEPTIHADLRIMVLCYDELPKIITAPPQARITNKKTVKKRQTTQNGTSTINWDLIIFDKTEHLREPQHNIGMQAANIAHLNEPYQHGKTPFTIFIGTNPWRRPVHSAMLARVLQHGLPQSKIHGEEITTKNWLETLSKLNISLGKTPTGQWRWWPENDAAAQRETAKLRRWFTSTNTPQHSQRRVDIPYEDSNIYHSWYIDAVNETERKYREMWADVSHRITSKKIDPYTAMIEYQQRCAGLKLPECVQLIEDILHSDGSIIVKTPTRNITEKLVELLLKRRITCEVRTPRDDTPPSTRIVILQDVESLPPRSWAGNAPMTILLLDYLSKNTPHFTQRAEHSYYNPQIMLPVYSNSVEEKLVKILTETTKTAEMKNLSVKMERSIRLAVAKTPPPNYLS